MKCLVCNRDDGSVIGVAGWPCDRCLEDVAETVAWTNMAPIEVHDPSIVYRVEINDDRTIIELIPVGKVLEA